MGDASSHLGAKRTSRRPDRYKPYGPKPVARKSDDADDQVALVKAQLRSIKDTKPFTAEPSLVLNDDGTCLIDLGGHLHDRSAYEVWNYAYDTNAFLKDKSRKIKPTDKCRRDQALFCGAVRTLNAQLFDRLNDGKTRKHGMFSVAAHIPDQAISGTQAKIAAPTADGMREVPGWRPMTQQANALVAQLAAKSGRQVRRILVNNLVPNCFIPISAYDDPDAGDSLAAASSSSAAAASSSSPAAAAAAAAASLSSSL